MRILQMTRNRVKSYEISHSFDTKLRGHSSPTNFVLDNRSVRCERSLIVYMSLNIYLTINIKFAENISVSLNR